MLYARKCLVQSVRSLLVAEDGVDAFMSVGLLVLRPSDQLSIAGMTDKQKLRSLIHDQPFSTSDCFEDSHDRHVPEQACSTHRC